MPQSPCLPRDTLKDYLNGSADDQRLAAIESHLADCPTCEQTVLELERDPDTLVMAVRTLKAGSASDESQAQSEIVPKPSVINRAVDAVRQLGDAPSVPSGPLAKPGQIGAQRIGAYELLRTLGRGGMGLVMLARHATLKKQVAIKILPSLIGDRPELVQRFQREIITAGQLNHPSIVHATDAGAEQGTHYLVMEYIDGLDLSRIARLGGPLKIADACELMRQTALGLSYAHAQGVVHRDVKPSNLMLDTAGRVKILDFGLAQLNLWEEAAVELTTVGQLMGTLDYMAPEQAERAGPVDYRADLYALGATLFRLLTGRAPLAAAPNMTLLEKVRMLGSQTAPLVSTLRDDCPHDLVQLIEQLLLRDPSERPASAAHVAEALLPFCVGHELPTLLTRCHERATSEPKVEETTPVRLYAVATAPAQPPRRTSSWWALAWLSPLAVCAGIVILLETQKGQLVIESDVAGVKVNLLQDGKVYQQLQVQTGTQSTRLFADKYAIEIDGASDEVAIDQSNVEIRRGSTVVARIKQTAKATRPQLDLSGIYKSIGAGDVQLNTSQVNPDSKPTSPALSDIKPLVPVFSIENIKPFDTNSDGFIDNQEALAFPEYWHGPIKRESSKSGKLSLGGVVNTMNYHAHQAQKTLNAIGALPGTQELADGETLKKAGDARLVLLTREVDEAKADLTQKTYELEHAKNLFSKGLVSELEYNEKRSRWEQAKSHVQKAEVRLGELTMTLVANELETAAAAAQPMYAGKSLSQWLDVLERDLETKTRMETLPAIAQLGKNATDQDLKRINQALATAIRDEVKHVTWSNTTWRKSPTSESVGKLVDTICDLNKTDAAFEVIQAGCLLFDGKITTETFVVLNYALYRGMGRQSCEWLLSNSRFQKLDGELAWLALALLETNLSYLDAEFCKALPKLVDDHPHLGLPAMLVLWPPTGGGRPELAGFEASIAEAACSAFLSDDSSPTVVALSANRLAATSPIVEQYRSKLVDKLKQRLGELAHDRERLLEALPAGPPGIKLSYQSGTNAMPLVTSDATRAQARSGRVVGSEILGMLALTIRLKAIPDVDEQLTAAVEPIFETALPLAVAIQSIRQGIQWGNLGWPFTAKDIARLNEPLSNFPPEVWRAAVIARTFRDLPERMPLFHTQLLNALVSHYADIVIRCADKNGDQKLWLGTETGSLDLSASSYNFNNDQFITKEEIAELKMRDLSRAFIGDRIGWLGSNRGDSMAKAEAVPGISEEAFAEIDSDADGKITLTEGVDYLLTHPNVPASKSTPAQAERSQADEALFAWARRMIGKYDKNNDGQLSADEWNGMIVKPKEGTDADGDGIITLEELAARNRRN